MFPGSRSAVKGALTSVARQVRFFLLLLVAALCAAATASATPMRPALSSLPFTQVGDAAAKAAHQTPICPNGFVCYSPSHLRDAYDFPNGRGAATGAGQTIVVVTAYGSPTIESDLAQFDAENGLPDPPSFTIVPQQAPALGTGTNDRQTWAIETSLDVEYAHSMAPDADIVLAVAVTDDTMDLRQVQLEVLPSYQGSIVSLSFGLDERILFGGEPATPVALDALYLAHVLGGGSIVASSGDLGASGFLPFVGGPAIPSAAYPASSPFVLAVGGTEGSPYPEGLWNGGRYGGEQAWNEAIPFGPGAGAGGGAPSVVYAAPSWQAGLTDSQMRAEPDVSYNAAFNGGFLVVLGGHHGVGGGTSAGAPQWAAIVALANELRGRQGKPPVGLPTPQLWLLAADKNAYRQDFHDITGGSNALGGPDSGLPGFDARLGYDFATGLGTPDVARLVKDLAGRDAVRLRLDDLLRSKVR